MKHNGTRLVKKLLFYSLIMSFSCATCMSTLGFCIIILYHKACTKYFPVLLCTTKLAQSPSQYYFVLQSLHKVLPSTTLYYKVCTKLAQSTSQYYFVLQSLHKLLPSKYYFVLQSLHKALPSITLYYKACTNYFPVLLCTTKQQNEHFVRDVLQFWHFRHVIKQVGMRQSATPATQNDMTTCLETFEKERFCSFPHRHGITR